MIFYDFEVFKYNWLVVLHDTKGTGETVIVDNTEELHTYYQNNKNDIWVGYNSNHYDQYILKGILCGFNPKDINDFIINKGKAGWMFSKEFNNYPLQSYDAMHKMQSLKVMESYLGKSIEETGVAFDIDRPLSQDEIERTIYYCRCDVQALIDVFMIDLEDFKAHIGLVQIAKLPLTALAKTKAQLSATILQARQLGHKEWDEEWQFEYVQPVKDYKYKNTQVLSFFDSLHDSNDSKARLVTTINGVEHVFALGGVHGAKPNYIEKCDDNTLLVHSDVGSLYPSLMIEWGLLSRAVPSIKIYSDVKELRLKYKHENNPLQAPLKLVLNSTYGVSGAGKRLENGEYKIQSPMYDPRRMREVCINGQLLLLQLLEDLENVAELIQSNTDGVIFKLKKTMLKEYLSICRAWEERARLKLEHDYITEIYQRDVNNYILKFDNGKLERKGDAVKESSPLDFDVPIIADAVVSFFIDGIDPRDTINNCNDYMRFMKTYKVSSKYDYAVHNTERLDGKVFRVFASKSRFDTPLYKVKGNSKPALFASCSKCYIDNGDITNKPIPRKLNKQYYIDEAVKRINSYIGID